MKKIAARIALVTAVLAAPSLVLANEAKPEGEKTKKAAKKDAPKTEKKDAAKTEKKEAAGGGW